MIGSCRSSSSRNPALLLVGVIYVLLHVLSYALKERVSRYSIFRFCLFLLRIIRKFLKDKERFVGAKSLQDISNSQRVKGAVGGLNLLVRHWFVPEDVTPDYYHFTLWRMFQRFVAGTVNVFGTQVGVRACVRAV